MGNIVVCLILLLMIAYAIRSGMSHFKGEGGCCGGGTAVVKKEKPENVVEKKVILIEGMKCKNCSDRVESKLNEIDGAAARVSLRRKRAVLYADREISNSYVTEIVEKAGYEVKNIL